MGKRRFCILFDGQDMKQKAQRTEKELATAIGYLILPFVKQQMGTEATGIYVPVVLALAERMAKDVFNLEKMFK